MPVKQDDWRVDCPRCSTIMEYQRTKKLRGGYRGWYYLCPVCDMEVRLKDNSNGHLPCRFAIDFNNGYGGELERKCSILDIPILDIDKVCGECSHREP